MRTEILGSPSFSHVHVDISPGEELTVEAGAMQSMSPELDMKAVTNGSFFSALGKKLFGGESFFVNRFSNGSSGPRRVTIAQDVPGEIVELSLREGQEICLQKGAYLAHAGNVKLTTAWAGFASWVLGEGLVKLKASGSGTLWYGAYGGMLKREVRGELKVDDGHLVAYDPSLKLKIAMAGGFFSSLFGGEGLVTRLVGNGTAYIQTRSVRGLAAWLNPKFR
ncbi:MAG: TIGR00266 family protein [Spirochaetota bacterium]